MSTQYPQTIFTQKKTQNQNDFRLANNVTKQSRANSDEHDEEMIAETCADHKFYLNNGDKDDTWPITGSNKTKVINSSSLPCKCSNISTITGRLMQRNNGAPDGSIIPISILLNGKILNSAANSTQNSPQKYSSLNSSSSNSGWMTPCRNAICRYFKFNQRRVKKSTLRNVGILGALLVFVVFMQVTFGVFQRCFLEKDFKEGFSFPLDVPDFPGVVKEFILTNEEDRDEFRPSPINMGYSRVNFIRGASSVTSNQTSVGLLIVVKSATKNYKKRMAIRKTWGDINYLQETNISDKFPTKLAFICGVPENYRKNNYYSGDSRNKSELFPNEKEFKDIILADFWDTYENNTYKTFVLMRWALDYVKDFKYLMIVDDDMYVNPVNVVNFLRDIPTTKVQTVISGRSGSPVFYPESQMNWNNTKNGDELGPIVQLNEMPLIMGSLCVDSKPFRNSIGAGSKWYVSVEEYPYNFFPPYAAGAATLVDRLSAAYLYYGSLFTKHFWVDDVYIGIIAKRLGITLTNSDRIDSSYRKANSQTRHDLQDMIAIHGLDCPEQLIELWNTKNIQGLHDCSQLAHLL